MQNFSQDSWFDPSASAHQASTCTPDHPTPTLSRLCTNTDQAWMLRTPLLTADHPDQMRQRLRDYFIQTFDVYESLFDCLADDDAFYIKPITLRHPLIFYYGHTATFFVNKLLLAQLLDARLDPRLESMCAVGVDEMSWDDLNDAHYTWPTPQEIKHYRARVRQTVLGIIDHAPLTLPITWQHPWWAIVMGIEHERIHLETSSVLIRQHDLARVHPSARWQPERHSGQAPTNTLLPVPQGTVHLHKDRQDLIYGWDNEYANHQAEVPAFLASQYLVSNQEFLAFVAAGGYQSPQYWSEEGQGWLQFSGAQMPTFWRKTGQTWRLRLMTEEVAMPWDWPVETNYHEAAAFCCWLATTTGQAVRLPTEDEWYRLYAFSGVQEVGDTRSTANLHLDHAASSCSVTRFAHGDFYDVVGNVWQWTQTPIYPFDGFDVHPIYDDFSTPTFDDRHNLMKGGSWISCGNESRHSARYAFRRHFFQHAGFRYVVGEDVSDVPSSQYETDRLMSEYAEFHYGDDYFGVANFSKALVEHTMQQLAAQGIVLSCQRALDLGCASGRATFELARYFDQVTGIDFSARFIGQGVQLAQGQALRYTLTEEGELVSYKTRSLDALGLHDIKDRVEFYQGDACNLKSIFANYDLIFAANLIDRLYDPAKCLNKLHDHLNVGGVLMLSSPYTWLADHTPRESWIGGFKQDGENLTTLDGLKALLSDHFELIAEPVEVPFVIRETRRKYQHSLSEVSLWRRVR